MITDPVCGAQINKTFAIAQETTTGKKQYFCSQACRDDFIRNNGK
ncbi:MAG: YHS domain-containing protein [Deltaproteobacteria bacterium]|nr:YHS domain-containing protein [Deltaproteobacteria bacterium]